MTKEIIKLNYITTKRGIELSEKMRLPAQFIDEISPFKTLYCLVSGGYHSTTACLLLKDYGFDNVCLVHNKTHLEMNHVLDLIQDLIYRTDYSYIETEPNLKGKSIGLILKESLEKIPEIISCFEKRKGNYRDFIPCCKILKKSPARKFYTKEINKENSVVISSLCPFESRNRNYWLKQLREKDTYIRLHKKMGYVFHAYPFRDIYSDRPFHEYLISKDIIPEHSGCIKCPIQIAYKQFKKKKEGLKVDIENNL